MKSLLRSLFLLSFTATILVACKSDDSEEPVIDTTSENKQPLGTSADDILSNDVFQSMTVEIAYVTDFRPRQETLDALRTFLNARVNKPGGINFIETEIAAPGGAPYTISEIRTIEDANRTQYNSGSKLAIFVFFADGSSLNDTQTSFTLGSAYLNTSVVIFEKTLRDLVLITPGANLDILETATTQHEFGHIFGLTNIINDDIHTEHEDVDHPKHCFIEECLMFFDASFATKDMAGRMALRSDVPVFDSLCIEDLQAKGGK